MFLDAIVAALLLITIAYCWRLSKKMAQFASGKKEMEKLIHDFNQAIMQAESSINTLQHLSKDADEHLRKHIDKARFLANDLSFLAHKGENVADRLEEFITLSRAVDPSPMGMRGTGRINMGNIGKNGSFLSSKVPLRKPAVPAPVENAKMSEPLPSELTEKIKPETVSSALAASAMSPAKKKALEDALAQIASRKKATVTAPSLPNSAENNNSIRVEKSVPKKTFFESFKMAPKVNA